MKVTIIGAGLTGLTAARRLALSGHQVNVFEKENYPGGLAASFSQPGWQWPVENFFHHLFTTDKAARRLIKNLGLSEKLFFDHPKTSIFYKGLISRFDSPTSVLAYPHLSWPEKIRTGLATTYLKLSPYRKSFGNITAHRWLERLYGKAAYQTIWKPLLRAKFGDQARQVSGCWFWGRIKKRSSRLGYLKGGFQVLIDSLVKEINQHEGKVIFNREIKPSDFKNGLVLDRAIFTTPTATFLKILGHRFPTSEREKLGKLKMLGAVNLVLTLKSKFLQDDTYWLNVNEKNFPFVAVVEHTNFINPKHYGGDHILYIGGYYPQSHRYFKIKKEAILKEFLPYLQKINPGFKQSQITGYELRANKFAQPVIPVNYPKLIPKIKTPVKNIYLANMQMIYPWDRGVNNAIKLGEEAANEVLQEN